MDSFIREEIPTEQLLHDQYVLEDVGIASCSRMAGDTHHHIASVMFRSTAPPIAVELGVLPTALKAAL
jgi:hypothetical protein